MCGSVPIRQVIQGDCLEAMKDIPNESIDHIITDFPYNVGKVTYFPSDAAYYRFLEDACIEVCRVLKNNGNFVFYVGDKDIVNKLNIVAKFFKYQWRIVQYKPTFRQFGKTGFTKTDLIWWFTKKESKGKIYRRHPDIIVDKKENMRYDHPCFKGEIVMESLVKIFTKEGDLVLDPMCGIGGTLVACNNLKRQWIGIEKKYEYCAIARKRVEAVDEPVKDGWMDDPFG